MKLGNLACGSVRPQSPEWWNVDSLRATLLPGTPERDQLDAEHQYIDQDLEAHGLPFDDSSFDGLLFSHALEHFNCQTGVRIMADCHRVLKPGGVLLASVPDASYFRKVYAEDTVENAERLFGEPIYLPDGETTFFGYGLWNRHHRAILTEDALWAYFVRAGFRETHLLKVTSFGEEGFDFDATPELPRTTCFDNLLTMLRHLNRLPFSLVMVGVKE